MITGHSGLRPSLTRMRIAENVPKPFLFTNTFLSLRDRCFPRYNPPERRFGAKIEGSISWISNPLKPISQYRSKRACTREH